MKFKRKKPSKTTNREIAWQTPKYYQSKSRKINKKLDEQ